MYLQADDILGEEIPEVPGLINEFRTTKGSIMSSARGDVWKRAFNKIKDKRLSSVAEDPELTQTPSGTLECESIAFFSNIVSVKLVYLH